MNLLLLGPSGCGKTTLYNAFHAHLAGNVRVFSSAGAGMLVEEAVVPRRHRHSDALPAGYTVCVIFVANVPEIRVVGAASSAEAATQRPHVFYVPRNGPPAELDWPARVAGAILALYPALARGVS